MMQDPLSMVLVLITGVRRLMPSCPVVQLYFFLILRSLS
jgi:hypothetical protein